MAAWLGGSAACVDSGPRGGGTGGTVEPVTCEVTPPVAYTGPAVIPSEDTAPPGPYVWNNVVIKGGGFVSGIIPSLALPGLVFARTDVGGAYRSDPANRRWMPHHRLGRAQRREPHRHREHRRRSRRSEPGLYRRRAIPHRRQRPDPELDRHGPDVDAQQHRGAHGRQRNGRSMGERLAVDPNLTSTLYFGSRTAGCGRAPTLPRPGLRRQRSPGNRRGQLRQRGHELRFDVCGLRSAQRLARQSDAGDSTSASARRPGPRCIARPTRGRRWEAVVGQPRRYDAASRGAGWLRQLVPRVQRLGGPERHQGGRCLEIQRGERRMDGGQSPTRAAASAESRPTRRTRARWSSRRSIYWSPDQIYRTSGRRRDVDGDLARGAQRDEAGAQWLWWHGENVPAKGWMGDVEIDPFDPSHVLYITGQGLWSSNDVTAADSRRADALAVRQRRTRRDRAARFVSPPAGAPLLSGVGDIAGFRHDDLGVSPADGMFGTRSSATRPASISPRRRRPSWCAWARARRRAGRAARTPPTGAPRGRHLPAPPREARARDRSRSAPTAARSCGLPRRRRPRRRIRGTKAPRGPPPRGSWVACASPPTASIPPSSTRAAAAARW